jgi:hypothetical protein
MHDAGRWCDLLLAERSLPWRCTLPGFHDDRHREAGDPYQVAMSKNLRPYRRDIAWRPSQDVLIRPHLHLLEFTQGKCNWRYKFRYGLFGIGDADFACITDAMSARNAAGLATT